MIAHLIKKELADHWRALLGIAGLQSLVLLVALVNAQLSNSAITVIQLLPVQLVSTAPIAATIAMQALFASEIRNKTILFLEALPISRVKLVFAKLLVGGALIFSMNLFLAAVVMALAARTEPMSLRFLEIVALKTTAAAVFWFALTFFAAVLGRYRWPFYLTLIIVAFVYDQAGGQLGSVPPATLWDKTFATERYLVPLRDVTIVFGASAVSIAFGCSILLMRSGSVALLLGEKMGHREKVLLAGAMILSVWAASELAPKKIEPLYEIKSASARKFESARVSLSVLPPDGVDIDEQMHALHARLEPLSDVLGRSAPPLFLFHRADLDRGRFEKANVEKQEGILIRANLSEEGIAPDDLAAFVTGAIIDRLTEGRSLSERRLWLRYGFSELWATRRDQLWLRALYARREGFAPKDIDRWFVVRETLGEPLSAALAWSGLVVLEDTIGVEATRSIVRLSFEPDSRRGLRSLRRGEAQSLDALLASEGRTDRESFLRAWNERLDREQLRFEPLLAALPSFRLDTEIEGSELSRRIRVSILSDRELGDELVAGVLWRNLPAIDDPLDPLSLKREERPLVDRVTLVVPRSFRSGARVFLVGSIFLSDLGCEARFHAMRSTVP
jgi:hypothetical protein